MESLCDKYKNGIGLEALCKEYHLGKLKIKAILAENGVEIRKKGGQTQKHNYKVVDWKIEKYPLEEGFYYEAHSKDGKYITKDYMNSGGFMTSYINKEYGIDIPSLYDRREYYKTTGDYWWEQWFDIVKIKKQETKKCPYCDWETIDIENKSGVFEQHLKDVHGKSIEEYLQEFPKDIDYFKVFQEECKKNEDKKNDDMYITCPLCGERLKKITLWHVKSKHNMSLKEFRDKFPNYNVVSKLSYEIDAENFRKGNLHVSKNRFISKYERELQEWLKSKNIEFESNRQILSGKEIDILIPSLHIGIEFDGLKWHTEDFGKKDRNYHVDKTNKCNEHGYGLIHIFEDEYVNHKDLVYHKLSHLLHLDNDLPKISGRKLEVKEILKHEAKEFLEKYHIQGFVSSTVYLG